MILAHFGPKQEGVRHAAKWDVDWPARGPPIRAVLVLRLRSAADRLASPGRWSSRLGRRSRTSPRWSQRALNSTTAKPTSSPVWMTSGECRKPAMDKSPHGPSRPAPGSRFDARPDAMHHATLLSTLVLAVGPVVVLLPSLYVYFCLYSTGLIFRTWTARTPAPTGVGGGRPPPAPQPSTPSWWPEFELDFVAYVATRGRPRRRDRTPIRPAARHPAARSSRSRQISRNTYPQPVPQARATCERMRRTQRHSAVFDFGESPG